MKQKYSKITQFPRQHTHTWGGAIRRGLDNRAPAQLREMCHNLSSTCAALLSEHVYSNVRVFYSERLHIIYITQSKPLEHAVYV